MCRQVDAVSVGPSMESETTGEMEQAVCIPKVIQAHASLPTHPGLTWFWKSGFRF